MPNLAEAQIATLLTPYLSPVPPEILPKLSLYLDLLLKWNARTNLTAIRDPEEIVRRHFGESLFAAQHIGPCNTLLDLGSGAGFPGLPIALLHPEIRVTLAESQNKKSTFLREATRTLSLQNVEIWPARAESMPPARQFHTVAMRAVDNMAAAIAAATPRATHHLLLLAGAPPTLPPEFTPESPIPIPNTQSSILLRATRA
ncbi:MAG TPA: 16S rRNA (guanine(527)-N(7))-methyltransferase RsmG [Edaphobacter sp.]